MSSKEIRCGFCGKVFVDEETTKMIESTTRPGVYVCFTCVPWLAGVKDRKVKEDVDGFEKKYRPDDSERVD